VRLSWGASTTGTYPIARYDIYRKQGASDLETAELVGEAAPDATQFLDRGPLERATYYYWVMCEDTRGNVSNPAVLSRCNLSSTPTRSQRLPLSLASTSRPSS